MKYDIYFHNDFDGRASAAVMLAFLRSRGDDIERYVPVDYGIIPEWLKKGFFKKNRLVRGRRNPAIVVDFLYHPEAAFWFDHHPTTFKKESWRKGFRPSRFHHYDPSYKSACHLVCAALKRDFGWKPPRHIIELVRWSDVIDGPYYSSPRQTFILREPALQVDAFIDEKREDPALAARTVTLLSKEPLPRIAKIPKVRQAADRVRKENRRSLKFYRKNMKVFGNATFINLCDVPRAVLRFASYYLFPKVRYGVRLTMKESFYHVGVGSNPWMKPKHPVHLGKFLRRYGGGGHKGAGGVDFRKRSDAEKAAREIVAFLSRKE